MLRRDMLIEPRTAAPGALRRWSRQAFDLLRRGFGFWSALSLLMCLWMFFGHHLPLLSGMLAVSALLACVLIAARLDRSTTTELADVLDALRAHARELLTLAALITFAGALVWVLLLAKPGVAWWNILYTDRNSVEVLSPDWFVALRQVFVYSAFALGLCYFGLNIPGLTSFFQFPCMTLLGLPFRDAWRLAAAGQIRNLGAMLAVALLFMVLPATVALLLPPLVPVLYCFLGALSYVAFREIFLGIAANQPRAAAAAVPAATPLSSRP
ncbi:MAG: hypothetical protein KGP27_07665 [Hyphomicrobiales bacterium]|nr:hypothetical protein [Hyphomicrobiales bacterium]